LHDCYVEVGVEGETTSLATRITERSLHALDVRVRSKMMPRRQQA